jgi:hypothetical protein
MKLNIIIIALLCSSACYGQTQRYNPPNESTDTLFSNTGQYLTLFYNNSEGCDKTVILDEIGFPIRQLWFFKGTKLAELGQSTNGERRLKTFSLNSSSNCSLELMFNEENELVEEKYTIVDSSMRQKVISFQTENTGIRIPTQVD